MTAPMNDHSIERAAHRLCAALHMDGIDPADIEVYLPHDAWWRLWTRLDQLHPGIMTHDGRMMVPDHFRYMGISYRVKR